MKSSVELGFTWMNPGMSDKQNLVLPKLLSSARKVLPSSPGGGGGVPAVKCNSMHEQEN